MDKGASTGMSLHDCHSPEAVCCVDRRISRDFVTLSSKDDR